MCIICDYLNIEHVEGNNPIITEMAEETFNEHKLLFGALVGGLMDRPNLKLNELPNYLLTLAAICFRMGEIDAFHGMDFDSDDDDVKVDEKRLEDFEEFLRKLDG